MSTAAQTLLITALFVLPGALYTGVYHWVTGYYRWGALSHYCVQLLSASTVLAGPVVWTTYHSSHWEAISGGSLPWWVALLTAIGYLGIPAALGLLVGLAVANDWRVIRWYTKRKGSPTAWDRLFTKIDARQGGIICCKLVSGEWVGGLFIHEENSISSFASGYPEPQQMLLAREILVDSFGDPVTENGMLIELNNILLIEQKDIRYLRFTPIVQGGEYEA